MEESSEAIQGSIRVSASLRSGEEDLTLFFTSRRLIVAHIKKQMGDVPGTTLLGRWAFGLERIFRSPGARRAKKRVERGASDLNPDEILRADTANFEIDYNDVVRVEVENSPHLVGVLVLTKDDKYEFFTEEEFVRVSKRFRDSLGEKVEIR